MLWTKRTFLSNVSILVVIILWKIILEPTFCTKSYPVKSFVTAVLKASRGLYMVNLSYKTLELHSLDKKTGSGHEVMQIVLRLLKASRVLKIFTVQC